MPNIPPAIRRLQRKEAKDIKRFLERVDNDPADLPQRVAKYRVWLAQKRAGRLPAYVVVGREGR